MTEDQLKKFYESMVEVDLLKLKSKILLREIEDKYKSTMDSCDHRHPGGEIAGPKFGGSYCGFHCEICGSGVSYERMGY